MSSCDVSNATLRYLSSTDDYLLFKIVKATDSTSCSGIYCNLSCDQDMLNELAQSPALSDDELYTTYQFWVFLLLMVACWIGQAVTISLGDAICFELLGMNWERGQVLYCEHLASVKECLLYHFKLQR